MDYFKSLIILTVSLLVGFSGCLQQDSSEIIPSSEVEQKNSTDLSEDNADGTLLEVSLTGSSRAERFLGSYDQIERLALDVVRNYGNKQVVTDLEMDNSTGIWTATVPKLIVGFDYTIRGHAYRPHVESGPDNDSWIAPFVPKVTSEVSSENIRLRHPSQGYQDCEDAGLQTIVSAETCENAANILELTFISEANESTGFGCYYNDVNEEAIFNNATVNPSSCDGTLNQNFCVCIKGAGKWVEIFAGEVQHPVVEGVNKLDMRLSPILDDRTLSVPRVTRIQRPFQLGTEETGNIEVTVDTVGTGTDEEINYRFRAVDNNSLPVTDGSRGTFSNPEGEQGGITSSSEGTIQTDYTAPDNSSPCFNDGDVDGQCPQKLQIRVSNLQEIGVSSHFTVYVTDNETAETTIDNNPVITSISAERVGPNQLQWTIEVSDDDPFDSLAVHWDYLFGEPRSFTDNTTDNLSQNTGRMQTVMEYNDSDDGMLLVTVCETNEGEGNCQYQNESSTSVEYNLIAQAFPEIVVCDDTGCELPNSLAGRMDEPKTWYSCSIDGNGDRLDKIKLTPKKLESETTYYDSNDGSCSGNIENVEKFTANVELDSQYAYAYPTQTIIDYNSDELKVHKIIINISEFLYANYNSGAIDYFNSNGVCGYTKNEWELGKFMSLIGTECWSGDNVARINLYPATYDTMRTSKWTFGGGYPNNVECNIFTTDENNVYQNACKYNDRIIVRDNNDDYFEIDNNTYNYGSVNQSDYISLSGNFKEIIYGFKEYVGITDSNEILTTDNLSENWNSLYQGIEISSIAHDRTGDYVIVDNGNLRCSVDNFTSVKGTEVNDVVFNQTRSEFFAVGNNGFWGRSENCMDWTITTITNVSTHDNQDDNISIVGQNDFIGIVTQGVDYSAIWTDNHIYYNNAYGERDSLIRSQINSDNYSVFDIDWYEAEERFIGYVEDEYGVTRIEDRNATRWSYWGGVHSNDNAAFVGIKKVVGARDKLLVAIPDNSTSGFLYMTLESGATTHDNWAKITNSNGSKYIFEIHAF